MKTLTGKFVTVLSIVVSVASILVVVCLSILLSNRENKHLEGSRACLARASPSQ